MKKILPILVSMIFIAGCGETPLPPVQLPSTILTTSTPTSVITPVSSTTQLPTTTVKSDATSTDNNDTSDQNLSGLDTTTTTDHSFTFSNLHFTLPNKYTLKKIANGTVYIRTDDTKHEVYLRATITTNTSKLPNDADVFTSKGGARITELGQDGIFGLYQVVLKNKGYSVAWDFQSNEPQSVDESEGLGAYMPETKVTKLDVEDIMKSIEMAK